MTNFLRNEIKEITEETNNRLMYAFLIDKYNQYKKKGLIDESIYNYLDKRLRKKYNIKK